MAADESSRRVHLTILPPQPTLDEIEEFVRQVTGQPMTPEDRAKTQRLLGELAVPAGGSSPTNESDLEPGGPRSRGRHR